MSRSSGSKHHSGSWCQYTIVLNNAKTCQSSETWLPVDQSFWLFWNAFKDYVCIENFHHFHLLNLKYDQIHIHFVCIVYMYMCILYHTIRQDFKLIHKFKYWKIWQLRCAAVCSCPLVPCSSCYLELDWVEQ